MSVQCNIVALLRNCCCREKAINITYSVCEMTALCGLVVRVSGYRYRGPGFDPRRYQLF